MLFAAEETAASVSTGTSGWVLASIFVGVFGVPLILGPLSERLLKVKGIAFRVTVVLFTLGLALAPFLTELVRGGSWRNAVRLGIDLAGGTNMVFQVDQEGAAAAEKEVDGELMDRMVGAIIRRINPSGAEEVTVRRVGQDRIEVIVPGADAEKVEQTKRQMTNLGQLEFALLANQEDHAAIIERSRGVKGSEVRDAGGRVIAKWKQPGLDPRTKQPKDVGTNDLVEVRETSAGGLEFLVVVDPDPAKRITGRLLKRAYQTATERGPCVGFTFNTKGGYLFRQLTTRYQPRAGAGYRSRLAVLLNDEIHSAPTINDVIGASGVIEGQFSQRELDELINVLNAGALEVPLLPEPIHEFTVSPLLGVDVQEKGLTAILVSAVAVFGFMLLYYWMAGAVADVCLLFNLILVMGTMAFIDATFTLPGLAGLVLTIGMAVDSNVLIYERMREEQNRGSSVRMSIHNGFGRALSAIIDSNVTTLITAVILYMIGTDQVKGFAVTLFIGIVMSMFSALYLGRLIFDILERKRWITSIRMGSLIGPTSWNFIGKTTIALICSLVVIVGGMATFFARGENNLDIDFRGGSMVSFRFEDNPTVDEVRAALDAAFESDISLERLSVVGEDRQETTLFRMRTTEQNAESVAQTINDAFAQSTHRLVRQHVEAGSITAIPAASPPASGDGAASESSPAGEAPVDPFAGGHTIRLTFGEPINALSVNAEMADALSTLKSADGGQKFEDAAGLVAAADTSGTFDPTAKGLEFDVNVGPAVSEADLRAAFAALAADLSGRPNFEEVNTFDSAVAGETQIDALLAMFFSMLAIIAYLWFRFQRVTFGLAAISAVIHDIFVVMGMLAIGGLVSGNPVSNLLGLEDFKINLPIIAAFMTIIGYSLNDTIVVFDRIREIRGKNPALTADMINLSLNQTLSRTLLTSLTTLIVVVILYAIGGEGIHGFAYCLVVGVIVGTYSTIYIAAPVLLWLMNRTPATTTR
jgi:SecD/SecF fusion protein